MSDEPPTLEDVQARLDELLESEPEPLADARDRELLELMGVGGA